MIVCTWQYQLSVFALYILAHKCAIWRWYRSFARPLVNNLNHKKGSGVMSKNVRKMISCVLTVAILLSMSMMAFAAEPESAVEYETNANGETFGNRNQAEVLGYEADLILAEGENGVVGYVRASDLNNTADSPTSAVNEMQARENSALGGYYIPLYLEDGTTVIGQFFVENGEEYVEETSLDNNGIMLAVNESEYAMGSGWTNETPGCAGEFYSGIKSEFAGVTGLAKVVAHQDMEIGGLGACVRIFSQSTGALVHASSWTYSTNRDRTYTLTSFYLCTGANYYYAQSYLAMWNNTENEYWTFNTYRTTVVRPQI